MEFRGHLSRFSMAAYDPFYAPEKGVLQNSYDFIACSDAIEHFHHPGRELAALYRVLPSGGRRRFSLRSQAAPTRTSKPNNPFPIP